jgi:hypothetical protein
VPAGGAHKARRATTIVVLLGACLVAMIAPAAAQAIVHDATVAGLVAEAGTSRGELELTLDQLTGVVPAPVGGSFYTIYTRNAGSGKPIDMAEQYVYERLLDDGLDIVKYQQFYGMSNGRNVIGEITGATRPGEVVVVCAHLDSWADPNPRRASGADDNASSVAALLHLAQALGPYRFERTLRFVFLGGEEWDYDGSWAYTRALRNAGENVVAVINADMIGENPTGTKKVELHTRPAGRGDLDIWTARRYCEAVATYGISSLHPHVMRDSAGWSDHWSFWHHSYSATCLIEDCTTRDNPWYHSAQDTVAHISWNYYVRVTQGLTAATAHLAWLQSSAPDGADYVWKIVMSPYRSAGKKGARATVTIYDSTLTPLEGARVSGAFSGATASSVSAVTDGYGRVRLKSVPRTRGGVWTFTAAGVTKSGWVYDPLRNVVSSAAITVP